MFVKKMMVLKGEIMGVCKLERLGEQWKCHIRLNDSYYCGDATLVIDKPNCEIGAIVNGKATYELAYRGEIEGVACYVYDDNGRVISYGSTGITVEMSSCESHARQAWETHRQAMVVEKTRKSSPTMSTQEVNSAFDIGYAQQERSAKVEDSHVDTIITDSGIKNKKSAGSTDISEINISNGSCNSDVTCSDTEVHNPKEVTNNCSGCDEKIPSAKTNTSSGRGGDTEDIEIYGGSALGSAMLIEGDGSDDEGAGIVIECDDDSTQPFYLKVDDRLQELFKNYPHDSELEGLVHSSRWVRVEYEESNFYVVGLVEEDSVPLFICYGVPVDSKSMVSKEHSPSCEWLPVDRDNVEGRGYWVLYQDAHSGEILT